MRQLPVDIAEAMIAAHLAQATCQPMAPETLAGYRSPWRGTEGVAAYWRAVACYDEDLAAPLAPRLSQLSVPARLLWGDRDAWLPPQKARELRPRSPAPSSGSSPRPDASPQKTTRTPLPPRCSSSSSSSGAPVGEENRAATGV